MKYFQKFSPECPFNITLALISANLLSSTLVFDFSYSFHHNYGFISGYKGCAFCSIDWEKIY